MQHSTIEPATLRDLAPSPLPGAAEQPPPNVENAENLRNGTEPGRQFLPLSGVRARRLRNTPPLRPWRKQKGAAPSERRL